MDRYKLQRFGSVNWIVTDTAPAVSDQETICYCETEHEAMVVWRAMTIYAWLVEHEPSLDKQLGHLLAEWQQKYGGREQA